MQETNYNPFKIPISKLHPRDLSILESVSEGWYVEYKSELPGGRSGKVDTLKIAKSITSFANTYGGWLFYGIAQKDAKHRTAGEFCGIEDAETAEIHLREAMVSHSNPEPYFETNILHGPCKEIDLPENRAVLVVHIPQSNSLPHVHGSGRIFRRVSDSSEPIIEKDRARLDAMWEQKNKSHDRLKQFFETAPPEFDNCSTPLMHIFLMTDPFGTKGHHSSMSFDDFKSIMSGNQLVYDNVYVGPNRYIARHVFDNDPNQPLFTWQYFERGASVVSLPINITPLCENNLQSSKAFFLGYEFGDALLSVCDQARRTKGSIADLNQLCLLLNNIFFKHNKLLEMDGISSQLLVKVRLDNMKGVIPFVDTKPFMDFIIHHGIPSVLLNDCYWPSDATNIFHIHKDFELEKAAKVYADAIVMFTSLMSCFGLPVKSLFFEGEDVKEGNIRMIKEFIAMHERSPRTKSN